MGSCCPLVPVDRGGVRPAQVAAEMTRSTRQGRMSEESTGFRGLHCREGLVDVMDRRGFGMPAASVSKTGRASSPTGTLPHTHTLTFTHMTFTHTHLPPHPHMHTRAHTYHLMLTHTHTHTHTTSCSLTCALMLLTCKHAHTYHLMLTHSHAHSHSLIVLPHFQDWGKFFPRVLCVAAALHTHRHLPGIRQTPKGGRVTHSPYIKTLLQSLP